MMDFKLIRQLIDSFPLQLHFRHVNNHQIHFKGSCHSLYLLANCYDFKDTLIIFFILTTDLMLMLIVKKILTQLCISP